MRDGEEMERLWMRLRESTADNGYSGMWLVFPTYMIYILGQEILEGLAIASGEEGGAAATKPLTIKEE